MDATLESVNRYISDIQQVLTRVADGDLRTEPQVDYMGTWATSWTSSSVDWF